jgi:hypothetical protein
VLFRSANDADLKFGPGLRQVRPAQAGGPQVVTGAFKPGDTTEVTVLRNEKPVTMKVTFGGK